MCGISAACCWFADMVTATREVIKIKRSLFSELKQRHVIQTVAAYTVLGWLLLQVADVVIPAAPYPPGR